MSDTSRVERVIFCVGTLLGCMGVSVQLASDPLISRKSGRCGQDANMPNQKLLFLSSRGEVTKRNKTKAANPFTLACLSPPGLHHDEEERVSAG